MDEEQIEAKLRSFIAGAYPARAERVATMAKSEDLWTVIDSMRLLELVDWVEQLFEISVDPVEFVPATFDNLDTLVRFIAGKMAAGADATGRGPSARVRRLQADSETD